MATRRTTFEKQQRERAKKAKAAAKRERRLDTDGEAAGADDGTEQPAPPPQLDKESVAELFAAIDRLHRRFEAHEIEHSEFEKQKVALLALLPID